MAEGNLDSPTLMNTPWLLWTLLFGAIGFVFFSYGKKQLRVIPMGIGVALLVYPYFVANTVVLVVIGAVLTAVPWFFRNW